MKSIEEIEKDLFDVMTKVKEIQVSITELRGKNPGWYTELEFILQDLIKKTGITEFELKSSSQVREISEVRQMFFKRAKETTNISLYRVGKFVNRDHATVHYGIKVVNNIPELKAKYDKYFNEKETIEDKKYLVPGAKKFIVVEGYEPTKRKSKYTDIIPSNNREFHGYIEHN